MIPRRALPLREGLGQLAANAPLTLLAMKRALVELAGYLLPAGVMVAPGVGLVHSDDRVYPDADRFDPDRM